MELTLKGMRSGWSDNLGECELGVVDFKNWIDISFPHTEEVLIEQNRPHYQYGVYFIPPKRKRKIGFYLNFGEQGEYEGFEYWKGKFSKKQEKEWESILSNWLINNGYAEK